MANPVVTFTMADGKVMKAELYPEVAPNTVNNFISLVKKGFTVFGAISGYNSALITSPLSIVMVTTGFAIV